MQKSGNHTNACDKLKGQNMLCGQPEELIASWFGFMKYISRFMMDNNLKTKCFTASVG